MERRFLVGCAALLMVLAITLAPQVSNAAPPSGSLDDCIHVSIGDLFADPGDDIQVPIYVSDVTGWDVMAFEMTFCWCPTPAGVIQFLGCSPGEVLLNSTGWTAPICGPCSTGCVCVAAAGTYPLVGDGVLFYLNFHVSANAKPCMCCDIWFGEVLVYDPEIPMNVCLENGSVCINSCDIYGQVNFWKCCLYDCEECDKYYLVKPLDGALVHLTDSAGHSVASQYTDAQGNYAFECLKPHTDANNYCVDIDFCRLPARVVTSHDAWLTLMASCGLEPLDDCPFVSGGTIYPQQVAADVNCSGLVTALDASLILQYSVGLIDVFPCPDFWQFFPLGDSGNCVTACPDTVDWIGVLVGDVSGWPTCPTRPGGFLAAAPAAQVSLGSPQHYANRVDIPIRVTGANKVTSVQMEIPYDQDAFSVQSVQATGLASGFTIAHNPADGLLRIGMMSTGSISGTGAIAKITLVKNSPPAPPSVNGRIQIAAVWLNDVAVVVNDPVRPEIVKFAVGPVAPNPFADGTVVRFTMATAGQVNLSIYNVKGQLVNTLVDGEVQAGIQSATWNGTDSAGNKVARGVYFCRMSTQGFSGTEKMLFMK